MTEKMGPGRSADVVIVAIDNNSLEKIGPWPWPRYRYARMIDSVTKAGARAIGLDLLLDHPGLGDPDLAATLAISKKVVLATYTRENAGQLKKRAGLVVEHLELPLDILAQEAKSLGHIALLQDSDGVVRRLPAFVTDAHRGFPAFGIAVAALSEQVEENQMLLAPTGLKIGTMHIPLDRDGCLWIGYQGGPGTFPTVSAADVIRGEVPRDIFQGKVVLIGVTATGLADFWTTPFATVGGMPGVEVHANVVQAILNKDIRADAPAVSVPFSAVLAGLTAGLLGEFSPAIASLGLTLFGMAVIWWLGAVVFLFLGLIPQIGPVFFAWGGGLAAALSSKAWTYRKGLLSQEEHLSTLSVLSRHPSLNELPRLLADLTDAEVVIGIFHRPNGGQAEVVLSSGNQVLVQGLEDIAKDLSDALDPKDASEFLERQTRRHKGVWLCVPIPGGKDVKGHYLLGRSRGKRFSPEEHRRISDFAEHTGLLLENRDLLEQIRKSDISTLQILLTTIRQKSPHLLRHSMQVADLGKRLAEKMGLDRDTAERIHQAGLLHDLGLVGLPDRILLKTRGLNTEERAWIETHPSLAADMLESAPSLSSLSPAVRHHHERYDGKGYPDGLAGREIPLEARILAVAEAYVTISGSPSGPPSGTSSDHTRQQAALGEIELHTGSQFDPEVVQALVSLHEDLQGVSNE